MSNTQLSLCSQVDKDQFKVNRRFVVVVTLVQLVYYQCDNSV